MSAPDLEKIAADLESLEETIIARLIDRAQFRCNRQAYLPGRSGFEGEATASLFEVRLRYQEEMDARFGRFCAPEERPFNRCLPPARRRVHLPENCLEIDNYDRVNLTDPIRSSYLELVARICAPGDDAQYGSSVEHDVYAIQAISRRIHYGALYVTESKYRADPETFKDLLAAGDRERLLARLTRTEVEARILDRVARKVETLQASAVGNSRHRIDPTVVRDYYADWVIPLTKEGQVRYLRRRLADR
ncbi:MAG: chorismate mutase [Desulfobacteraceae bacterium]|nr:chorismate mutase [Desulfobacteraceae bacterium]